MYKKLTSTLVAEEIEKMVEGTESDDTKEVDDSILNGKNDPGTRLDPESYKESLMVEKTIVIQPVNVMEEEEVFDRLHQLGEEMEKYPWSVLPYGRPHKDQK
nr:hypothetical protein [Tanacetum cinerariifolium]